MIKDIELNEKFEPLLDEETRYYVITGERGATKSFTVNTWLTSQLLKPKQTILFTRFTLASAKDSIIPEFKEKIDLLNLGRYLDIQTHDITNIQNKSKILFRGIKTSQGIQTAKLKSLTNVNIWVLDEAEELVDEEIFDKIDLSVRKKGSINMVIMILNPAPRTHWIYERFFKDKVKEDFNGVHEDTTYIYTTLLDNIDNIDQKLAKSLLKLKEDDPKAYQKRMSTSWLTESEDIVLNDSDLNKFDIEDVADFIEHGVKISWCDVADQGDDNLCNPVGLLIDEKVYVIDVVFSGKGSEYTCPLIIEQIKRHNISRAMFESNNQGLMFTKLIKKTLLHMPGYEKFRKVIGAIPNTKNKHSRIVVQSETNIIKNFYFLRKRPPMYENYYNFLTRYRYDKSVKQDDAPDATAGLSILSQKYN